MEFVPPLTRGGSVRGEQSYYQNVTGGWIAVGLKTGRKWRKAGYWMGLVAVALFILIG